MHQEEYKGHTITVDTLKRRDGWVVTYQTDGGEIHLLGPAVSEERLRGEAIAQAKWIIDNRKGKPASSKTTDDSHG